MKKPMTRVQAWRYLAKQFIEDPQKNPGICMARGRLYLANRITGGTAAAMSLQLWGHLEAAPPLLSDNEGYVFPPRTHQDERAMACLWMALEAQDEDKQQQS